MSRKSFCYKTLETYDKPRDQLKSFCRDGGNSGYYNISSTRGICNDDGDCRVKENFQSGNQPASKNLCQPIAYDDSKGSKCKSGVCKNCCGKWTDDDPALARTFCDLCLNAPLPPVSTRTAAPCQWTDYTCGSESADVPALEGERCDHVKPKMPPSVCRISNDKVSLRCMTPSVCRGGAAYDPSGCGWSGGTPPPTQENFQPIPSTAWQQPASVRGTWDQVEGLYELNPQSNSCVSDWKNREGYGNAQEGTPPPCDQTYCRTDESGSCPEGQVGGPCTGGCGGHPGWARCLLAPGHAYCGCMPSHKPHHGGGRVCPSMIKKSATR